MRWYLEYYIENEPKTWARKPSPPIHESGNGQLSYRLSIAERKRILLDHIYGVDIDAQAVEVTKLSLLLEVLEGASQETLDNQLRMFHERALPDLAANIKCGNSLIGPDFYDNRQMSLLDDEKRYRINVFDWEAEFANIMNAGGFDAVIGNPPYIDSEWMTTYLSTTRSYCVPRYQAASGNWDIFCVFAEKAVSLCRSSGLASFIVPNKLASAEYAVGARTVLAVQNRVLLIRDYSHIPVFPVAVYPIVYIVQAEAPQMDAHVRYERMATEADAMVVCSERHELNYRRYFSDAERPWEIFATLGGPDPTRRMRETFPSLRSVSEVLGAATVSEAYEMKPLFTEGASSRLGRDLRVINSGTIDRYSSLWGLKPMRYLGKSLVRPIVPKAHMSELPHKRLTQAQTPKIIIAGMTKRLECVVDLDGGVLAAKSTTVVFSDLDLRYLLAILNSRLIGFCYTVTYGANKLAGGYLRIGPPQLRTMPIATHPKPSQHRRITERVQSMLDLHKQLAAAKTPTAKTAIQRQIDATDKLIDKLVYELYDLTDDEIRLVEEATG